MRLVEPLWKLLLSTKSLLPLLWELFPGHPNLLRAERTPWGDTFVRKPLRSREGANVDVVRHGTTIAASGGRYGAEGFIYQELCPLPVHAGRHAVIGSWVVGDTACGIGIREDAGPVTTDRSCFVPHLLLPE
jgi:glutathionylspermidine synthase